MNRAIFTRKTSFLFILLVSISAFLLLFRLGTPPLQDYDEAIYAQVISDTEHAGDFLTLHNSSSTWFQKPPLYFWLAMGSEKMFGKNEFALRFPSAILGLAGIVLTYLIALELSGSVYMALLGGAILLMTGSFLEAARQLRLDIPVTTAILFVLYSFVRAKRDSRWYIGIGVGIAIGIMFKSVIGVFALPIILIWAFFEKDWGWVKNKYLWYGFVTALLILLPWHVYETLKFGSSFWNDYLFHQILDRFSSDVNGNSTSNWQYMQYTFLYVFPWILVFIGGGGWLLSCKRPYQNPRRQLAALGVSVLFIFGIFLIAKTKIFYYVTPAFPLIALFCTLLIYEMYKLPRINVWRYFLGASITVLLILAIGNTLYVGYHFQSDLANNVLIVHDEYKIGTMLRDNPEPKDVRAFEYYYWDTIRYYSGGRHVALMQPNDTASQPFFMIIETTLYQQNPFSPIIMKHLIPVYEGDALTLLEFRP